jgi:hypothetical protein
MGGLPPLHFGNLVIYAGDDKYLQFLWDGLRFHEMDFDLRPALVCLLVMSVPFIYAKLRRPHPVPKDRCPVWDMTFAQRPTDVRNAEESSK